MGINDTQFRVRWLLVVSLAGLAFLFLLLDSTGNLNTAFNILRDPLAGIIGWTAARSDAFADALAGPSDLREAQAQIAALQNQLAALERENAQLRDQQGQSQIYIDLFNRAREAPDLERLTANVIGRDTSPVFRSLIIDAGSADGVQVGMPVESASGLVGQVYRTTAHSAQVLLISDNISSVAGRLSNSRASGLIAGGGAGGLLTMNWIELDAVIQNGEAVFTSGLSGKFPPDLVIGRIIEVNRDEAELFQQAVIQPAVDFDTLEVVFVIINFEPIDTTIYDEPPESVPTNP